MIPGVLIILALITLIVAGARLRRHHMVARLDLGVGEQCARCGAYRRPGGHWDHVFCRGSFRRAAVR